MTQVPNARQNMLDPTHFVATKNIYCILREGKKRRQKNKRNKKEDSEKKKQGNSKKLVRKVQKKINGNS